MLIIMVAGWVVPDDDDMEREGGGLGVTGEEADCFGVTEEVVDSLGETAEAVVVGEVMAAGAAAAEEEEEEAVR